MPWRRLLNLLTALSLVLCVAVVALWVRSYPPDGGRNGQPDSLYLKHTEPLYWFVSYPGKLVFCRQEGRNWDIPMKDRELLGVSFGGLWGTDGSQLWNVKVPYWMLATATLVPVPLALRRILRHRRAARRATGNLCPACGYDLRATPGRCPECGAASVGLR